MVGLLSVLLGIVMLLSVFCAPVIGGVWILRPLDRAAKSHRRPTRFTILDFLGLVFLIQMPMALIHALVPRTDPPIYWTLLGLGWLVSLAVWAMAVKTFSNAGITNGKQRAILVFFVLPSAYFATFALVILAIVLFTAPPSEWATNAICWVIEAVLLGCVIFAGRLTRQIARASQPQGGKPFADDWKAEG